MSSLTNKNSEYFLTVAKEKSISKAAKKLFISQSYLSQYILKLESTLDMQLFDRSKSPIEITEAGKIYYDYLENSNRLYTKLTADFDTLNKQRVHTLNLGFAPWRGSTLLPDILPIFIKQYPNVQVVLHEHQVKELYGLIEKNVIDVGIMNSSLDASDKVTTEFITYENIVLVANKEHPLTERLVKMTQNNGEAIDLKMLEDECFIYINFSFQQPVHKSTVIHWV
ncbi:MAG: LysR family transcriptional regulator [Synergistaceae bacterium]|nr:LysR family transcriptional regulator [Synergistaceae bacterium]